MLKIILLPSMTAAQAEQVKRDTGMDAEPTAAGNLTLVHRQKLEAARKRFGRPFAHQPGTDWKPRTTPVLLDWLANHDAGKGAA